MRILYSMNLNLRMTLERSKRRSYFLSLAFITKCFSKNLLLRIIIIIIIIIIINFRNLNCHIWKYFIPFLLEPNKLHFTFVKQRQNRMTFSIHCEKSISKN